MSWQLFYHPFSSYCQKVLVAFYENGWAFEPRLLAGPDSPAMQELGRRWPMKRFPVLVDGERGGQTVLEATCIIEYAQLHRPGPVPLLPSDARQALQVRMLDRFFDNYVSTPQQKIVFDALRPPPDRDPAGVADARAMLDTAYAWLEQHLAQLSQGQPGDPVKDAAAAAPPWVAGAQFSLADCAAAPFLFYADWTHAIGPQHPRVRAYRQRLLARPAMARAVDEARPYRPYFPLGAPDRD